jgi:predicted RNase H-like HicB family nuclease
MKVRVLIHRAEEGGFWAEVPALPGCVTEAETMDELKANIRDAMESWLAVAAEQHAGRPGETADGLEEIEV